MWPHRRENNLSGDEVHSRSIFFFRLSNRINEIAAFSFLSSDNEHDPVHIFRAVNLRVRDNLDRW